MSFIIINSAIQASRRRREEEMEKRLKLIEEEGKNAFFEGKAETNSPYIGTADYINWFSGYNKGKQMFNEYRKFNKKTFSEWLNNPKLR